MGMIRAAFFIELVNAAVTSTKFECRWVASRLERDPRGCSFEECASIFLGLLDELVEAIGDATVRDLLDRFRRFKALAYEVPLDYRNRDVGHCIGNVCWLFDDVEILRTLLLRELVSDRDLLGSLAGAFHLARNKTLVKTYLTDRAQTGGYPTDREKRWEAHPDSVQFAFRRDCLKIEHELLSQICHFEGFPVPVRRRLLDVGAALERELPARCPITRAPLRFDLLQEALEQPRHGHAAFQVGHLSPLKGPGFGPEFGHTPANVAWITADGNRIQGDLSYDETMTLLRRIHENHARYGDGR
jgi:hypothetical protein